MPLYEYLCEACGKRHEALQRMTDPALTACPHCGGALRKLLSAPAFQFKGSGWYQTDYARKPVGGDAPKADGDAPKSGGDAPAATSGGGESKADGGDPPAKPSAKPAGE